MPTDELKDHATSTLVDYYDLLGVNFETSEADIRRAYRRTALKYHPDKNVGKPENIEKFHILQIAYDVLSDPTYKALYDNTRRAQKDKEERDQAFEGKRRKMKEDLERRESGFLKRKREEDDEESKLQREIQRLAEDGKRRRKERQEMLAREKLEEEERLDREKNGYVGPQSETPAPKGGTAVPEIDRSVKVIWSREGQGETIDKDRLTHMFETFGNIEAAFLLKDKKRRLGDQKSRTLVATGVIVFCSAVGAQAAVQDFKKHSDPSFKLLDSVFWASNKEPEFLRPHTPTTPSSPNPDEFTMMRLKNMEKRRLEEKARRESFQAPETPSKPDVPKFSFSPAASINTPIAVASPGLEELTKTRLRNAEKKRLEEQIRKEDAESNDMPS